MSASPDLSGSESSTWSWSWLRTSIFGSPNLSTHAFDGDYDERMRDDLNVMELRDGKRLSTLPWERSGSERDRQSEFADDISMASVATSPPDFYSTEDFASYSRSSASGVGSLAGTSTGFSSPGGRRYLSFAECQQLPKTDYVYAYTPVYSPSIYRTRNIEMPNMCRKPIRSSASGSSSVEHYTLRSRTSTTKIGTIPLYGTDYDQAETPRPSRLKSPVEQVSLFTRMWTWLSLCCCGVWFRLKSLAVWVLSAISALAFFVFVAFPIRLVSFSWRNSRYAASVVWQWLVICFTWPVSTAASVGGKTIQVALTGTGLISDNAVAAIDACCVKVTHFWMTIRRVAAESTAATVSTAARTTSWLRRFFWPILILLLIILLLLLFPYGLVYKKASEMYNQVNTTKFFEFFAWPESPEVDDYVTSPEPAVTTTIDEPRAPPVQEVKFSCEECWKPYSQQISQLLADRDKDIFSKLDVKLAAILAADKSEAQLAAANDRLAALEGALVQLRAAVAEAQSEVKRTFEDSEALRQTSRSEDREALRQAVDDMWLRVDAKVTASADALEQQLLQYRTDTDDKIEASGTRVSEELRQEVASARLTADDAMAKATLAADAFEALPPPVEAQPPVVVECKTECPSAPASGDGMSSAQVKSIVTRAIAQYDADRTGMPDFALESSGGSVVSVRCSKTYDVSAGTVSIFGFPVYFDTKSPRTTIQAGPLVPGNCWAFSGSRGYLVVRLSYQIYVTSVSIEHIPKEVALFGKIDSAPREFSVYALANESDNVGTLLGNFTYDAVDGPALQTFATDESSDPAQFLEMRVLSNHGHPNYTCIYRLRVHGRLADPNASAFP